LKEQLEKAKELQREYLRQWRNANKDRVKRYNSDYWLRKAYQLLKENGGSDEQQK